MVNMHLIYMELTNTETQNFTVTKLTVEKVYAVPVLILSSQSQLQEYLKKRRGGSRAAATSKMECFVIIVNGCSR